jgi:hypothetical protein
MDGGTCCYCCCCCCCCCRDSFCGAINRTPTKEWVSQAMKEAKVKGRGYLRKVWGFVFGHVCMNALDEQVYCVRGRAVSIGAEQGAYTHLLGHHVPCSILYRIARHHGPPESHSGFLRLIDPPHDHLAVGRDARVDARVGALQSNTRKESTH